MAQQKTVASILHFVFSYASMCVLYLAAVHCKDLSDALQENVLLFGWVASMSLYDRLIKGMLVGPAFTQGPKGSRGSSRSRGSKTSERGRNIETEEEKTEMGRDGSNGR